MKNFIARATLALATLGLVFSQFAPQMASANIYVPWLEVYAPYAGEQWLTGGSYKIAWQSNGVSSNEQVRLTLEQTMNVCVQAPCLQMPALIPYVIADNILNSGSFEWNTPKDLPFEYQGVKRIKVQVVDKDIYAFSRPVQISALKIKNLSPVITGVGGPTNLKLGETGEWRVTAYDPDGTYLNYEVNFGEFMTVEQNKAESMAPIFNTQTGKFNYSYQTPGDHTITFTVSDKDGLSTKSSLTVFVSGTVPVPYNQPPQISVTEYPNFNSLMVDKIGSFKVQASDPDGDYLNVTVDWGDYKTKTLSLTTPEVDKIHLNNIYTFEHSYSKSGNYLVTFTATDKLGAATSTEIKVKVYEPWVVVPQVKEEINPTIKFDAEKKLEFNNPSDSKIKVYKSGRYGKAVVKKYNRAVFNYYGLAEKPVIAQLQSFLKPSLKMIVE